MRIAQLSDFHFTRLTWNPLRLFSKRIFGNCNWLLHRGNTFSEVQLEPLPELFSSLEIDLLLLGGDFTTTALPEEFEAASQFLARFKKPWIAVPGNHDHYTKRSYRVKRFYQYFSHPKLKDEGIAVHRIAPTWVVIALDTSRPTYLGSSRGLFSEELEQKLETVLQSAEENVLLFNHYPFFQNDAPQHTLRRGEALETLIRRYPKIRAYLHGHTHRHTIADLQPSGLPLILDSGSCAQGAQGFWNLIDLSDKGCIVTAYRWETDWRPFRRENVSWCRK